MRAVLYCLVCVFLACGTVFADGTTVDDLMHTEDLGSFDLSPNGRFIVISDGRGKQDRLIIKDLEEGSSQALSIGDVQINWARWVSDERLVVSLIIKEDVLLPHGYYVVVGGTRVRTMPDVKLGRMIAINRDGTRRVNMMANANDKVKRNVNLSKIASIVPSDPDHILMPAREKALSLFKVNIHTGEAVRVDKGKHSTFAWKTDRSGKPIARYDYSSSRRYIKVYVKGPKDNKWEKVATIRKEDLEQFTPIAETEDPTIIFVSARPEGQDKAGLFKYDMATKTYVEKVSTHPDVDIDSAIVDAGGHYFASSFFTGKRSYEFQDKQFQSHYDAINTYFKDEMNVTLTKVSQNGKRWIIYVTGPTEPGAYYSYSMDKMKAEFVAFLNTRIDPKKLGQTKVISFTARDGTEIPAYYTPAAAGFSGQRPLIVLPHGGPQERDYFGFDPMVQYFTSRGYNIFQPNFRGSSGFGQNYAEAGFGQWGGLMQDDVTDGVKHMIESGRAATGNICIAGVSYGGYAALMGAIKTPDIYKCAASVNGVSDLPEMIKYDAKKFGKKSDVFEHLVKSMGDPKTDNAALQAASPMYNIEKMTTPLLLIHGVNDGIVPVTQTQDYFTALRAAGIPARYIELKGVNHSLIGYDADNPQAAGTIDWTEGLKSAFQQMDDFFRAHLNTE